MKSAINEARGICLIYKNSPQEKISKKKSLNPTGFKDCTLFTWPLNKWLNYRIYITMAGLLTFLTLRLAFPITIPLISDVNPSKGIPQVRSSNKIFRCRITAAGPLPILTEFPIKHFMYHLQYFKIHFNLRVY